MALRGIGGDVGSCRGLDRERAVRNSSPRARADASINALRACEQVNYRWPAPQLIQLSARCASGRKTCSREIVSLNSRLVGADLTLRSTCRVRMSCVSCIFFASSRTALILGADASKRCEDRFARQLHARA